MKKLFALTVILALVLAACEQPTDSDKPTVKVPSLTIKNESSFDLTDVKFSGLSFTAAGSKEREGGSHHFFIAYRHDAGTLQVV